MSKILIVPVVLESDKLNSQNEYVRYPRTIEADFYPRLIKELQNNFREIGNLVSLYDPLMLDRDTIVNSHLFNKSRNQWYSKNSLEWVTRETLPNSDTKILAICDFDAYSNGLNFVFGEAQIGGRVGAIYISRLRQEFYGYMSDTDLFLQRIIKETVHELGHLFGLSHCERKNCVMHFSNSLKDTDFKGYYFCVRCTAILFNMY
jgi:archaemetzincin